MGNITQDLDFKSTSDGWRGKLAENFTFSNVALISNAITQYILNDLKEKRIVIGYDTRFMSKEFAYFVASLMQDSGIDVDILSTSSPTPFLTFAVNKYHFPLGINITASHNPPFDDGIKIRMNYGGTPTKEIVDKIESYFKNKNQLKSQVKGSLKVIDPTSDYIAQINKFIDNEKIKKDSSRILIDTMHGTTYGFLGQILRGSNVKIDYLHGDFDPYFGGINPEPKFESTLELQEIVKSKNYDLGIAHDGDGDRIVAALPSVGYLSPHDIASIMVLYLSKYKKLKGKVLGSSTLGRRVSRVCESLNISYESMPVGFKNATEKMLKGGVMLAAEENGGLGFGFYIPERDTTLAAALLLEAQATVGIEALLIEVENMAGKSGFCRFNYSPSIDRKQLFNKITENRNNFNFKTIDSISDSDGIKVTYANGDWLSIRYSGTEEILRIYCESDNRQKAVRIKNFAIQQIKLLEEK